MNKYTVVGYYTDNNQPFVHHIEAKTPIDACKQTVENDPNVDADDMMFLEVFEGHLIGVLENEYLINGDDI